MPDIGIVDEALVVELDDLPAEANARIGQAGIVGEEQVDIGFVRVEDQRVERGRTGHVRRPHRV
ncbi:MAG: hypothetical protein EXR27_09435 [Betaproteobacteria bacterium]|nr:hypothetical protein [Betaproteobacteria bacterium]